MEPANSQMAYALMEWDEYGNIIPFGEQRSPQRQPQEWDEFGYPVSPQAPQQAAPQGPPPGYTEAAGGIANLGQGASFGFNDEIAGAIGGGVDALQGRDFSQGYQREATRTREYRDQFLRDRPMVGNALQGTGAAAPVMAALATGQPQLAAGALNPGRAAAPGLAMRMGQGAATGSAYGYAYGFGSADGEPVGERMLAGNDAAVLGGAIGGVLPPAFSGARYLQERIGRPAWDFATGAARQIPVPAGESVGAMGRPMRRSPATPNRRPERFDPVVGGALERLANRSRQTPERIESRLREYRMNPNGEVLADAFDQPGVQTLRSMTQSPGQTGQRAAEVARQRFTQAPERILGDLNRRMAVAETPEQALASLRSQYERVSAENYQPVFAQPMSASARQRVDARLQPYRDDPVLRDADARAQRIFTRDRNNETVTGTLEDNYARYLHYLKMGLDEAVAAAPIGSRGLQSTEMRGVFQMRQRILNAIDENVPGYRQARAEWGGLIEAEEALAQGATMLNMTSGALRQQMQAMSPFARYHARVGFANAVGQRMGLRGSVNGNRNVAEVLGSPEMQARTRAMFDSPEEAAAFLDTLNQQNMLMRNAQQWNGGSTTGANAAHMEDNASNALEAGIDLASGRRTSAVSRARNIVTGGLQERANNRVGETLLRRVDNDADFARLVVEELRRREAARLAQAQAGRLGGATAGSQQGDN